MNDQQFKQDNSYYQQLPEANLLQKKCLKRPWSIFPLIQLPDFKYSEVQQDLLLIPKNFIFSPQKKFRSRSSSPKKSIYNRNNTPIFHLQQVQLKSIFDNPLYSFTKRLSNGSNKNFCNIKIFYQQSADHKTIPDNPQSFFLSNDHEQNLSFQSRFQSGNLAMVSKSKVFSNSYNLLLTKDLNTARCTQWFFFRVLNKKKAKYTFNILNFFKNYSSFEHGMQICVASRSQDYIWKKGGQNILYRKTNVKIQYKGIYALSFDYSFQQNQDITYFAYSFPYTYSQLDKILFQLEEKNQSIFKRKSIGTSLGGNNIDMITISNFKVPAHEKRIIFLTARVHPGQTPSSFVIQGIIKKLIQNSQEIQNAREKFIFKIIPMLNPDGVINGNYRCSLSGYDLNRIWNSCNKDKYPEIYSVKKVLQYIKKPFLFIDLHAHSKKKGAFMYGCSIKNNPFICRQIPFLLWKNIKQFNYFQCNFSVKSKQREGTARMCLFKQFGVNLSYTMEHSFCGPLKQKKHFTVRNLLQIGENLILTIQKFYGRRKKQSSSQNQMNEVLRQLYQNKDFLNIGQNDDNQSSSDSELEEQFQIQIENNNQKQPKLQKMKLNSKVIYQSTTDKIVMKTSRQQIVSNTVMARISSFRQKPSASQIKLITKKSPYDQIPKIFINQDGILKSTQQIINFQTSDPTLQFISQKKQDQQNFVSKRFLRSRYSEEEVNDLTNLFLPSVTSSSYKKYNKPKFQNKGIVHVGRKFLENAGILKQQIKSVTKRKIQWKNSGKTFF